MTNNDLGRVEQCLLEAEKILEQQSLWKSSDCRLLYHTVRALLDTVSTIRVRSEFSAVSLETAP